MKLSHFMLDTGHDRVYFKLDSKLHCLQRQSAYHIDLFSCSRDGEPEGVVPKDHLKDVWEPLMNELAFYKHILARSVQAWLSAVASEEGWNARITD